MATSAFGQVERSVICATCRCRWGHQSLRGVGRGSIDTSAHTANDRRVGGARRHRDRKNTAVDESRIVVNSLVGQRLSRWQLIPGRLAIVLGIIVLGWHVPTILVVAVPFGVYLLMSGLAGLVMAFAPPRTAAIRVLLFVSGALSAVWATLSFRHFGDGYAVVLLSLRLRIGFIVQGTSGVAAGIGTSDLRGRGWYVVAGIVSVIAGVVVLAGPFSSIAVLTLAAGIWLLVIAITQTLQAFQTSKGASVARQTVDEISNRMATALSD
jgi:uncharacterized membrane protein HdeD (DUF308 family)